jgi:deoxyribodipyrimidine photo-lyase
MIGDPARRPRPQSGMMRRMSRGGATIVWLRLDLRLEDNPALAWAVARGGPVVPVYVWAPGEEGDWPPGAASRWWLHQSLAALGAALEQRGSRLVLRAGPSAPELLDAARASGADAVAWNRRTEPALAARDAEVARALGSAGLETAGFTAHLLFEPGDVRTREGRPFQVLTPFWRACLALDDPAGPVPARSRAFAAPRALPAPRSWPVSHPLATLGLEPTPDWAAGLRRAWRPGEAAAQARLRSFLAASLGRYPERRDIPGAPGTSRLSPHLHFGEIGPRQVWRAVRERARRDRAGGTRARRARADDAAAVWLRELGWREFAHHLLHHFPHTTDRPLRESFAAFPWSGDEDRRRAWERGRTGYPIVDAGMRELWETGWMHNRVRMIAASFLVKHLRVSWSAGARWFWDTLVDADLANNTFGWQWSAGCGADAAPYFRIFNPVLQGRRFDPAGRYVTRWVPEVRALPAPHRHAPWEAPAPARGYAAPIVDHAAARRAALDAFAIATRGRLRRRGSRPPGSRRRPGRTPG